MCAAFLALTAPVLSIFPAMPAAAQELPVVAQRLRNSVDRETYEAGAVDAAKELARMRTSEAMELRLELFDARWDTYRGVFLRDWFYAGMLGANSREEGDLLARAAADRKRSAALRRLCLQALAESTALVDGVLLFDDDFLRAPAPVLRAWQAAAGRTLADGRAQFAQESLALRARSLLLEAGPPYLGHAHLEEWTSEEQREIEEAAQKAKDPADRAEVLHVLASRSASQTAFATAAVPALRAAARAPRMAVLRAATQRDQYELTPALIAFLEQVEKEDPGPWSWEASETLRQVTGMPFGPKPEIWRRWWQEQGATWLAERRTRSTRAHVADGVRRFNESATVSARFFGLPVDSSRVALVIDGSGSMSSSRLGEISTVEAAAREAKAFCAALPDGAVFQVWVIEREPVALFKKAMPASAGNRLLAEKFLRERPYRSTSAMVEAFEAAMLDPAIDTIVYVGDGGSSAGLHAYDEHVLAEARRLHARHGVRIHAVLVTDNHAHADLLQGLADATGGRFARPGGRS